MPQSEWGNIGAVLWLIMSLAIVLFIAWLTLRFMSKRTGAASGAAGSIKVLDRVIVGKDQSILLVKCGEKMLVVAFSNGGATVLTQLTSEEQAALPTQAPLMYFSSVLQKTVNFCKHKKGDKRDGE